MDVVRRVAVTLEGGEEARGVHINFKLVHTQLINTRIPHLRLMITLIEALSIASSLAVKNCCCVFGRPTVLQVKIVLSSGYNGDRVRLLVNVLPDSANGEMVTRLVVFDKGVPDLNQVTKSMSTSSLGVIVQVSVTEVVPAYSVPLGWTVTVTLGVGTVHGRCISQVIHNHIVFKLTLKSQIMSVAHCNDRLT